MIVCEQTSLCAFVKVGCFAKFSLGYTVLCSACIKKVLTSQRAGPRFVQNSMLYGSSSQWSDGFNVSRIVFYWWHWTVGTGVCTRSKPNYTQHMFVCLCIFWFRGRPRQVLEISMECSRHEGWNHPIRVHLAFRQTQLVEMVTWQVQYVETRV